MSTDEVPKKKLSLWHSATLRPILTHAELEPILAATDFVPVPLPAPGERDSCQPDAVAWREYVFLGGNAAAPRWLFPRPRLPFPRVDGLHLKTYQAFLGDVEACLGAHRVGSLFHVRLMLATNPDRVFDKVFRPMRTLTPDDDDDDYDFIVYREGTLDDRTLEACRRQTVMRDDSLDIHHVIPGTSCRDLGYLRKLDYNCACHDAACCGAEYPVAGHNSFPFPVMLRDICPNLVRR